MKRWITLREATEYAPLGSKLLIQLARQRVIRGGTNRLKRSGEWFFDVRSIDALFESMEIGRDDPELEQVALALLRKDGL